MKVKAEFTLAKYNRLGLFSALIYFPSFRRQKPLIPPDMIVLCSNSTKVQSRPFLFGWSDGFKRKTGTVYFCLAHSSIL